MIWHLPHIRALAAHWGGPVTLIAKPRLAADQLFVAEPAVGEVLWMDRNPEHRRGRHDGAGLLRLIAALRARRFRRAVLLHHSRTLAFAMLAAGIPERYGTGSGHSVHASIARRPCHRRRWGCIPTPRRPPGCKPPGSNWVTQSLGYRSIRAPDKPCWTVWAAYRAYCWSLASAVPSLYKQWGVDRFTALALALAASGWPCLALAGGTAEAAMAEEIAVRLGGAATIIPAIAWSLPELAALCAEAAFYVGNDTGVMNLAASVGIRSYGLFGATPPFHHVSRIVPVLPPDGPLMPDGMARIAPDAVLAVIRAGRGSVGPIGHPA